MTVSYTHLDVYKRQVSNWSGGKTTQLFIYPENSEYAKRNFLFRISSATVDCERSEFTSLPGVDRVILPLKGSLHLFYEGHGEKVLAPYEQDRFDGGWNTAVSYTHLDVYKRQIWTCLIYDYSPIKVELQSLI